MEWLNYHHLQCFWLVARRGGLVPAGKALRVSPSTVWSQLRAVEARLGTQLLFRQGRKLKLTPMGERVARIADDIFSLGQDVLAVASGKTEVTPPIRVGVIQSVPRLVVRRFIAPVLSTHRVVLEHGRTEELLGELASHRLEVVLTDEPSGNESSVKTYAHPVDNSRLALFCHPDLHARLAPRYPKSLEGAPMLLPTEASSQRQALNATFAKMRVQPKVAVEADDSALLKALAADGHGIVAAPDLVQEEIVRMYGLVCLGVLSVRESYFALTLHQRLEHLGVASMLKG